MSLEVVLVQAPQHPAIRRELIAWGLDHTSSGLIPAFDRDPDSDPELVRALIDWYLARQLGRSYLELYRGISVPTGQPIRAHRTLTSWTDSSNEAQRWIHGPRGGRLLTAWFDSAHIFAELHYPEIDVREFVMFTGEPPARWADAPV